jgi:Beta-propeller repeat/PEP-CTERM motif
MTASRRLLIFVSLLASCAPSAHAESIEWIRQLGTSASEQSGAVATDGAGNVYISGFTSGSLGGPNAGFYDAFVSKFNATGNLLWTRQLGTTDYDSSSGVTADGLGNIYICGTTDGDLASPNAGNVDSFISKFNSAGALLWTRQIGTPGDDYSGGISADQSGNVYVSGDTTGSLGGPKIGSSDAFVNKYDAAGNLLWTRQLGTSQSDEQVSISADGLGNVYISGVTRGSLGGPPIGEGDAFICKYGASGNVLWTRQLGTTHDDESHAVSSDALGNVYIAGATEGDLDGPNAGDYDAFVSKYDAAGSLLWTRQLGTTGKDIGRAVSADGLGNVYVSGEINGGLGGTGADAFVSKYDATGNFLWLRQLGTPSNVSFGVAADDLGSIFFSGYTFGSLNGPNAGTTDAFVAKIADSPVPEPSTFMLAAIGILGFAMRVNRQRRSPKRSNRSTFSASPSFLGPAIGQSSMA